MSSLLQVVRAQLLGEAVRCPSHVGAGILSTSVGVVVDEKIRSNRREISEEVDQCVARHVRIIKRLS